MLAAGIALALPVVWLLGRLVESQLFGVRPMDWGTVFAATALVAFGAFAASALPARRATTVNPIQALRYE
jgi:ABC-type antimicrobial peptide transport system permease subunit